MTSLQMNMLSSSTVASIALTLLISSSVEVVCFAPSYSRRPFSTLSHVSAVVPPAMKVPENLRRPTSSLNVWWFGGNGDKESLSEGADSCELVAVRIDRTSANSRRIAGEITVDAPLMDCWSILTDYNRLSIHVPNLVESKIIQARSAGVPGDGEYQCRLYQKGAQKIIGFEFGADVTMEMTEKIISSAQGSLPNSGTNGQHIFPPERKIGFRCVDSFFFSEFDGEWKVVERIGDDGKPQTTLSYTVEVRPKGPVPVAALEWRIREDVPTNLRAVKKAAMDTGAAGVSAYSGQAQSQRSANGRALQQRKSGVQTVRDMVDQAVANRSSPSLANVQWADDETMAAYLNKKDP